MTTVLLHFRNIFLKNFRIKIIKILAQRKTKTKKEGKELNREVENEK